MSHHTAEKTEAAASIGSMDRARAPQLGCFPEISVHVLRAHCVPGVDPGPALGRAHILPGRVETGNTQI